MTALRWGFIGCGEITNDFVTCVQSLPKEEHQLVACAASDEEKAKQFAAEFGIQKAYGNYEALASDADVDVVYVGTINPNHYEICKMLLAHDKHILCEKPLTLLLEHTKELLLIAEQKKKFFQEAVWSRFFPAYKKIRDELKAGTLGEVKLVKAQFGVDGSANPSSDRLFKKQLGGGSLMDIGGYCTQFIIMVYGPEMPQTIQACGILNKDGVDTSITVNLQWKDGRMAQLATTFLANIPSEAHIFGSKKTLSVKNPFWCPTQLSIDEVKEIDKDESHEKYDFPLPTVKHELKYPHSEGLTYEAQEVRRCIKEGLLESPLMTHKETLIFFSIYDEIHRQLGIDYRSLYQGKGASSTRPQ